MPSQVGGFADELWPRIRLTVRLALSFMGVAMLAALGSSRAGPSPATAREGRRAMSRA